MPPWPRSTKLACGRLWESVLRHDGLPAFYDRVPGQLISWEQEYGWTRRGWGQTAEQKETQLAVQLTRLLTTPGSAGLTSSSSARR